MRAMCWNGVRDLRVERVRDPEILNPSDIVVEVHLSSVCGSDLHLVNGFVPSMEAGDIIGHEFLGRVVDVGPNVMNHRIGDRVVVSSIIGCGCCFHCARQEYSLCDNSNPHAAEADAVMGYGGAGIFGYSHLFGGYAGSHAEYVRVPFGDRIAFSVPDELTDEAALFCSDALPTGWMGAELAEIAAGDTVAVWGCGGVGQMAIQSAWLQGAGRVIAIDRIPERLEAARRYGQAEVIDYTKESVTDQLDALTGGRGPDRCIEAVGMEAHGTGPIYALDKVEQALMIQTDRGTAVREAIRACRKGGTVSIMGVYAGSMDRFPLGMAMNKALRLHMGQMHGPRYARQVLELVQQRKIDTSFLMTHRWGLERGTEGYRMFANKTDGCMRVVFDPRLGA
jgi:threonine dehydrogenase-like Zn-dependent dehydrogenase